MAIHRLIECAITGSSFPMYGDGSQVRDFTYVGDAVAANALAASVDVPPGSVLNIGGGAMASLSSIIETVEKLLERGVRIDERSPVMGERPHDRGRHATSVGGPRLGAPGVRGRRDWSCRSAGTARAEAPSRMLDALLEAVREA